MPKSKKSKKINRATPKAGNPPVTLRQSCDTPFVMRVVSSLSRDAQCVYWYVSYTMISEGEENFRSRIIDVLALLVEFDRNGANPVALFDTFPDPTHPLRIASKLGVTASEMVDAFGTLALDLKDWAWWVGEDRLIAAAAP